MGPNSVRRNLFHHHLSRRPVSIPPNAPATSNGLSGVTSHMLQPSGSEPSSSVSSGPVDNGDIVVRDKTGAYKLDIPVLPSVVGEDGDEIEAIEGAGVRGGSAAATGADSGGQCDINGREKEKIEASLVEMMYRSRNRQMSSEPQEILNLIQQSLRNKVSALDEDNWMYEPEADTRL